MDFDRGSLCSRLVIAVMGVCIVGLLIGVWQLRYSTVRRFAQYKAAAQEKGYPATLQDIAIAHERFKPGRNGAGLIARAARELVGYADWSDATLSPQLPPANKPLGEAGVAWLRSIVEPHRGAIELARAAAQCEYLRFPLDFKKGVSMPLGHHHRLKYLISLLVADATLAHLNCDAEQATRDLTAALSIIHLMTDEPTCQIMVHRDFMLQVMLVYLPHILSRTSWTDQQLEQIEGAIARLSRGKENLLKNLANWRAFDMYGAPHSGYEIGYEASSVPNEASLARAEPWTRAMRIVEASDWQALNDIVNRESPVSFPDQTILHVHIALRDTARVAAAQVAVAALRFRRVYGRWPKARLEVEPFCMGALEINYQLATAANDEGLTIAMDIPSNINDYQNAEAEIALTVYEILP